MSGPTLQNPDASWQEIALAAGKGAFVGAVAGATGSRALGAATAAFGGASELRWTVAAGATVAAGVMGAGTVYENVVTAAAGFDLTAQLSAVGRYWFQGRELDAWTNFYRLWGAGFQPSSHQGVSFRSRGDPVLYLSNPAGVTRDDRRRMLETLRQVNERQFDAVFDPEIATRIAQHELAYHMQASAPKLTKSPRRDGGDVPPVWRNGAAAGQLRGEYGRATYSQGKLTATNSGRDHHGRCFTIWLAGGGVKSGHVHGEADDYCHNVVRDPVHVHDQNPTLLHCRGIDHTRLTFKFQCRHDRLTDVEGQVVREVLA